MKAKHLFALFITLVFIGCDDNTGSLGLSMLPESDGIKVNSKNFDVRTMSELSGPVYAKTSTGYVGKFTDKEYDFGHYEGSFLTELNCIDNLEFPKPYDPVSNRNKLNMVVSLDSAFLYARLSLLYTEFFGDSLNPMQLGVYELGEKLDKNHYTDIDPDSLLKNPIKALAKRTFTAADLSDSTRFSNNYYKSVSFILPDEFGKKLISENWDHPEYFANSDEFIQNVLKGVYIKTEAGDGTVLYVDQVILDVAFRSYAIDSVGGILKTYDESTDSIEAYGRTFASTKEVIQANRINISNEVEEKVKEEGWTYLKSPAGIITQGILPLGDIVDIENNGLNLDTDTINSVKLTFTGYPRESTNVFSMGMPQNVLLIRSKDAKDFFEKNQLPDNKTSYLATLSNNKYAFTNITRLVTAMIDEMKQAKEEGGGTWNEETWLEENTISIIPVKLSLNTSGTTTTITNVQNDLQPSFIKLKGGKDSPIDLQVIYTTFNE